MSGSIYVIVVGEDSKIEYASEKFCELLATGRKSLENYTCHELPDLPEHDGRRCEVRCFFPGDGIVKSENHADETGNVFVVEETVEIYGGKIVEVLRYDTEEKSIRREMKHEFSNQMQILSSIMNLDAGEIEEFETRRLLKKNIMRMKAFSMIYEYQCEIAGEMRFKTKSFLKDLLSHHYFEYERETKLDYDNLKSDISCGNDWKIFSSTFALLCNEIFAYVFDLLNSDNTNDYSKSIFLSITESESGFAIGIKSDFSEDDLKVKYEGLDEKTIIELLTKQLGGKYSECFQDGFEMLVVIPEIQR